MTARKLESLALVSQSTFTEEEFSIPLDMSDIINICKEYNKLGYNIQNQVENILEVGIAESINTGILKQQSLPIIKDFLQAICRNPYFGDCCQQSTELIEIIDDFLSQNISVSTAN